MPYVYQKNWNYFKKTFQQRKILTRDCINELYQILKEEIWQFYTSFSKNWRVGKTFQLTIYSQHYFETETRQRFYNITYEYTTVYYCCCLVAKSWSTLCNPMDCSSPGFPVHWTSHLRILEWVAISFSRGSSWPRDQTCVSCTGRWILYCWATREAHIVY